MGLVNGFYPYILYHRVNSCQHNLPHYRLPNPAYGASTEGSLEQVSYEIKRSDRQFSARPACNFLRTFRRLSVTGGSSRVSLRRCRRSRSDCVSPVLAQRRGQSRRFAGRGRGFTRLPSARSRTRSWPQVFATFWSKSRSRPALRKSSSFRRAVSWSCATRVPS